MLSQLQLPSQLPSHSHSHSHSLYLDTKPDYSQMPSTQPSTHMSQPLFFIKSSEYKAINKELAKNIGFNYIPLKLDGTEDTDFKHALIRLNFIFENADEFKEIFYQNAEEFKQKIFYQNTEEFEKKMAELHDDLSHFLMVTL